VLVNYQKTKSKLLRPSLLTHYNSTSQNGALLVISYLLLSCPRAAYAPMIPRWHAVIAELIDVLLTNRFLNRQKDHKDGKYFQITHQNLDIKLRDDLERMKKIRYILSYLSLICRRKLNGWLNCIDCTVVYVTTGTYVSVVNTPRQQVVVVSQLVPLARRRNKRSHIILLAIQLLLLHSACVVPEKKIYS
jgi:hypothetical protein